MKVPATILRGLGLTLALVLVVLPLAPALAQLGGVTPPVETPPAPSTPEPTPQTVLEPVVQVVTPPADTTGPVISGLASLSVATHDATLVWTTDELAASTFEYGATESYGSHATLDATLLLAHTAVLINLTPGTTYHYCIHATDLAGNITNSCGHTFATAAQTVVVDTTPPDVTLITVAPVTTTSATIGFTTSEVGNARVEYGTTEGYGESTPLDTNLALTHSVTLSNLTPNTLYHYRIITGDEIGNETITTNETFTTAALGGGGVVSVSDITAPVISDVGTIMLGLTDATIAWSTNELTVSTLEYGTTQSYGLQGTLSLSALLGHSATLTGLSANTTYYYCIHATDLHGNSAASCPHSFTTGTQVSAPTLSAPTEPQTQTEVQVSGVNISGVDTESIATSTATITWQTDVPADSQVEYGDSENFGSLSSLSSTLTTSHAVTISGLAPNTNYIFRVKSKPLGGSLATTSSNYEFNTLSHSAPVVPPANVTAVSSGTPTATSATITWATDKAATSQVEYGISTGYGVATIESTALTTPHSVALNELEPNTTYHFRVKSTDEVSNLTFSEDYTFTTPSAPAGATGSSGANVPAAVTTLAVGGYDNTSAELTWQVGTAGADIASAYDVRYSTSPINTSTFDGASEAQLTSIYYGDLSPNGVGRAYIVAGLNANTTYYFAITLKHENSAYSDISNTVSVKTTAGVSISNETISSGGGSTGSASTSSASSGGGGSSSVNAQYGSGSGGAAAASFEPTMVKAEPADGQIVFEWNNPGEANFVRTVVVRKEGSYPSAPTDGERLYEGRGQTYTDTGLQNGSTYYYAVYSYNHARTYSRGINLSLAPNAGNKQVKFNESGSTTSATPTFHFVHQFKKGDQDIEIEHLQEILVADGESYPEAYVTGYFGVLTEAALKRFQAKHSLPRTGIVDAATQAKLNTISHSETRLDIPTDYVVFATDLKYGDRGDAVKDLQQYLIYEGSYAEALITAYFGSYTQTAVMKFQKKYSIQPVSGYVGYKTRHKMQQLAGL